MSKTFLSKNVNSRVACVLLGLFLSAAFQSLSWAMDEDYASPSKKRESPVESDPEKIPYKGRREEKALTRVLSLQDLEDLPPSASPDVSTVIIRYKKENEEVKNYESIVNNINDKVRGLFKPYPDVKSLDLSSNFWFEGERFLTLLASIEENAALTSLNLSGIRFDQKMCESIAHTLKTNTFLTELNLTCTFLTSETVKPIAEALPDNHFLKTIKLADNKIGHDGFTALFENLKNNTSLTSLDVAYGLNHPADFPRNNVLECLRQNTTLQVLSLKGLFLGTHNRLPLAFISALPSCSLTSLDMSENNLKDDLETFELSLQYRGLRSLKFFYLKNNQITDIGAVKLANCLKGSKTLKVVDLTGNKIRENALNEVRKANTNIQVIMEPDPSKTLPADL